MTIWSITVRVALIGYKGRVFSAGWLYTRISFGASRATTGTAAGPAIVPTFTSRCHDDAAYRCIVERIVEAVLRPLGFRDGLSLLTQSFISVMCYLHLDALPRILSTACQIGRGGWPSERSVVHHSTGSLSDEFCGLSRSIT